MAESQPPRDPPERRQPRQQGQPQQRDQSEADPDPSRQAVSVPLLEGEQVLINVRPAWSAFFQELLLAALVVLGGLVQGDDALVFGVLVGLVLVGYVWWKRQRLRYVVTDRRVIKFTGMGSSSTNEAFLRDVRNLRMGASLFERVLGHGHVAVSTEIRGSSVPIVGLFGSFVNPTGMTLGGISNYREVAEIIRRQQGESKR